MAKRFPAVGISRWHFSSMKRADRRDTLWKSPVRYVVSRRLNRVAQKSRWRP
ncbi:Uncharacterised protein [Vibrio cholerae]|nr:Uncharacterised protein [Vibrio cholerae]